MSKEKKIVEKNPRLFLKLYFKGNNKKPFAIIEIDNEDIFNKLVEMINNKDLDYITICDFTFKKENLNYIVKEYM